MLFSLVRHAASLLSRSDIVVMHHPRIANFSPQNQQRAQAIVPHIQFEPIEQPAFCNVALRSSAQSRRSALLTLEAFRPRVRKYEKIVFLDADMLCVNSFEDAVERADATVSAVPAGHYNLANRSINTGFFILRYDRIADGNAYRQLIDGVSQLTLTTWGLDQVVINQWISEQAPSLDYLPHEYNLKSDGLGLFESPQTPVFNTFPRILHFCGSGVTKPWQLVAGEKPKYPSAYGAWQNVAEQLHQTVEFEGSRE